MIEVTRQLSQHYSQAVHEQFAEELVAWWDRRFPWYRAALGPASVAGAASKVASPAESRAMATARHVMAEAESNGFEQQDEMMSYSVGYLCFGSRFYENPLLKNLMSRCYWQVEVDASLKLVRLIEHVDMFMWDKIFSVQRGCFYGLPDAAAWSSLVDAPLGELEVVLERLAPHRLPALDRGPLDGFARALAADLGALRVPHRFHLAGVVLGVYLGRYYLESPAYAWLAEPLCAGDMHRIVETLHG